MKDILPGWKNETENCWKGSYTVEAAVVMPLIFLVLASLIIAAFYVHDRSVLQGMACEISAEGRNYALENDRKEAVTSAKQNVTASGLLGSRDLSVNAAATDSSVNADLSAVYPVPGFSREFLTGDGMDINVSWESETAEPSKTVRKIRGAGKLFNDVKELITGGDK